MLKVIGTMLSPWVRRVVIVLEEKGITYELEPYFPFGDPPEEFKRRSPLRLVPVMDTDDGPIADSAAICAYLEAKYPEPALVPSDPFLLARSVWFCAYADALFRPEGTIFFQRVVRGHLMKEEYDNKAVEEAEAKLPEFFRYLDRELEGREYLCGPEMGLADITTASVILNYLHTGGRVEASTYPQLRGLLDRMFEREAFRRRIQDDLESLSEISSVAVGE